MDEPVSSKKPSLLQKAKWYLFGIDVSNKVEIDVGAGTDDESFGEDLEDFANEYPEGKQFGDLLENREQLWDEEDEPEENYLPDEINKDAEKLKAQVKEATEAKSAKELSNAFNYNPLRVDKEKRYKISLAYNKYKQKKAEKKAAKTGGKVDWEESTTIIENLELGRIPEDIEKLRTSGVALIVGCIDAGELNLAGFTIRALGKDIKQVFIPMEDFGAEVNHDLAIMGIKAIKEARAAGKKAYVHCKAGRARSLMEVCCYLLSDIDNIPELKNYFLSDKSGLSDADRILLISHLKNGIANEQELSTAFDIAVKFVQTKRPQVEISTGKKLAGIAILQKYFKEENDLKNGIVRSEKPDLGSYKTKCELSQLPALKDLGLYKIELGRFSSKGSAIADFYNKLLKYNGGNDQQMLEKSLFKLISTAQKTTNLKYQILVHQFLKELNKFATEKNLDIFNNPEVIKQIEKLGSQITLAKPIINAVPDVLKQVFYNKGVHTDQIDQNTLGKVQALFSGEIEFKDIKTKYQEFLKLNLISEVKDAFFAAIALQVKMPTTGAEKGEKIENRQALQMLSDLLGKLEKYRDYLVAAKNTMQKNQKEPDFTAITQKITEANTEIQKRKKQQMALMKKINVIDSDNLEKIAELKKNKPEDNTLVISENKKAEEEIDEDKLPADIAEKKPETFTYTKEGFQKAETEEEIMGPYVEKFSNRFLVHPAPQAREVTEEDAKDIAQLNKDCIRQALKDFIKAQEKNDPKNPLTNKDEIKLSGNSVLKALAEELLPKVWEEHLAEKKGLSIGMAPPPVPPAPPIGGPLQT